MLFQDKTSPGFFDKRYREKSDPWNFANSEYEQNRFTTIAKALAGKRYRRAFEPGCSIGTLTERLATFCGHVDACDFSETAVNHARQRCAALPNITFSVAALSGQTDLAGYDLILFSEIGYYFTPVDWRTSVARLADTMDPGATVLASHWLGHSSDHRMEGDQVHEILRAQPLLQLDHEERHEGFRLDRFTRVQ